MDEVFNRFLEGSSVFKDREALRHDYVPDELPHREIQIHHLGEIIAPALRGFLFSNIFIYGKPGTGKTAVMKHVLSRLISIAERVNSSMRVCYVNCRIIGTEYRVFSRLCSAIDIRVPFTGLAIGEIFDRFKSGLNSKNLLLIVVLDEIDSIVKDRGDALLYNLTRINSELSKSKLSIIGISNDLKFKELLDPRVLSTLSEEEVLFKPYNAVELQDILWKRAEIAFLEEVLSSGAVRLCAALAAAEHGDARRALDLLRVAGEISERMGSDKVLETHIRSAAEKMEHNRVVEALKNLPTHSKIVLLAAYLMINLDPNCMITGNIYEIYSNLCVELGIGPLTQRRISSLINELDAMGLLNSRVVSFGRYGRTKKIRFGITPKIVENVFSTEERFKELTKNPPRSLTSSITTLRT